MKNYFQKVFITGILLTTIIIPFSAPRPAEAQWTGIFDAANFLANLNDQSQSVIQTGLQGKTFWKDFVLNKVAFTIAQNLSDRMVRSVIDWANTGFTSYNLNGDPTNSPFFVVDYQRLFRDIAGEELVTIIDLVSGSENPYASQVTQTLIRNFQNQAAARFDYELRDALGVDRHDQYIAGNFSAGGWDAYLKNIEGSNNQISLWLNSQDEALRKIAERTAEKQLELESNSGLQGQRECREPRQRADGTDYCARYAITTPGSLIEEKLSAALTTPERNVSEIDQWGELLIQSLVQLTDGLTQVGVTNLSTAVTENIDSLFSPNVVDISEGSEATGGIQPGGQFALGGSLVEVVDITTTLQGSPDDPTTPEDDSSIGLLAQLEAEVADLQAMSIILRAMPPKIHALDVCLPGPDIGWEERLNDVFTSASARLQRRVSDDIPNAPEEQFYEQVVAGATQLKQSMTLQIINPEQNIPSAFDIQTALSQTNKNLSTLNKVIDELTEKSTLLAELGQIWTQWDSGNIDPVQKTELLKKFKVLTSDFTYGDQVNEVATRLDTIKRQSQNLDEYLTLCRVERANLYPPITSIADFWLDNPTTTIDVSQPYIEYLDTNNIIPVSAGSILGSNQQVPTGYRNIYVDPTDPELGQFCYNFIDPQGYEPEQDIDGDGEVDLLSEDEIAQLEPMRLLTDGVSTKYRGIACSQFYYATIDDYYPDISPGFF